MFNSASKWYEQRFLWSYSYFYLLNPKCNNDNKKSDPASQKTIKLSDNWQVWELMREIQRWLTVIYQTQTQKSRWTHLQYPITGTSK